MRNTVLSGAIIVVLLLFFAFFFETAFDNFHTLLFAEGTWIFPMDSVLIKLYPPDFFFDTFLYIFFSYLGAIAMLGGIYHYYFGWSLIPLI